jgi:hypothetical protein
VEEAILNRKFDKTADAQIDVHAGWSHFGLIFKAFYSQGCGCWITPLVLYPFLGGKTDFARDWAHSSFVVELMIEMLVSNGMLLTLHYRSQTMCVGGAEVALSFRLTVRLAVRLTVRLTVPRSCPAPRRPPHRPPLQVRCVKADLWPHRRRGGACGGQEGRHIYV